MRSSSGERYVYLKGEVLLFLATPEQVLKKAEACISKSYTANKHSTFTEYTQKIRLPMELALKYLQWKIIPPFPAVPLDNKLKNQSTIKEGENMRLTSRS